MNNKERSGIAFGLAILEAGALATTASAAEKTDIPSTPQTSSVDKFDGDMPSASGLDKLNMTIDYQNEYSSTFTFDSAPVNHEGHIYLPMRALNDALGGETVWNGEGDVQTATFTKDGHTLILYKNAKDSFFSKTVSIDGAKKTYDYAPAIIDLEKNRTLGSARLIAEGLSMGVDWFDSLKQATLIDPNVDGKIVTLTLGSKEGLIEQNTYLNRLKRAAYFANPADRQRLISLIETNVGPVEPPVSITDEKTGAQINFVNKNYANQFATQEAMLADYNSKFADQVELNERNTVYVFPDKLAIYTDINKKTVEIYTASTDSLQQIDSNSNIIVSYDTKLTITNAEGSKYNEATHKWEIDVTKTPEYANAKKIVVERLNYAYKNVVGGDAYHTIYNGIGIDKSEIDKYAQTGSCEGLKSFQVLNYISESGLELPGLIMVTGEYGLKQYATEMKQGIDWLNTVDPSLVRSLIKDTYYISGNIAPGDTWKNECKNYWSSYVPIQHLVLFHESWLEYVFAGSIKSTDMAMLFYLEADAIRMERNGGNPMNSEKQKRQDILVWLNQNSSKIDKKTYDFWVDFCESGIKSLSK